MQIEISFMPGRFDLFDICPEHGIESRRKWAEGWSIFIKNSEGTLIRFSPTNAMRVRYGGHMYETMTDDDQLAMLKRKLETDFAVESLD